MKKNLGSLKLDRASAVPLHLQLKEQLLRAILNETITGDYKFMSERSLAEAFDIHRATAHRVYVELLEMGIVQRNADRSLSLAPNARKKLRGPFPIIGVIIPSVFSTFMKASTINTHLYFNGMMDAATDKGASILFLNLPPPDAATAIIDRFITERCEPLTGLVHLGDRGLSRDKPFDRIIAYTGIPQVFLSGFSDYAHIASICADASVGLSQLSIELRKRGVKRMGIINQQSSQQQNSLFTNAASSRCATAQAKFTEQGIEILPHWHISIDENGLPTHTIRQRLADSSLPDAFWCINDQTAKALIDVLESNHVSVPGDVSVIGYDGASTNLPGNRTLATIQQYNQKLGGIAILKMLEYFDHGINSQNRIVRLPTAFQDGTTLKRRP